VATSPDRVATITEGVLLVWDRRTGKRIGNPINLATDGFRADHFTSTQKLALGPTGQVSVIGPDTIEFWDPATGSRVGEIRDPVAALNPRTGRQNASLRVAAPHDLSSFVANDGRQIMLYGLGTALPVMFPLAAQGWYDQLCNITDRSFTAVEQALLPSGVDEEPPCG